MTNEALDPETLYTKQSCIGLSTPDILHDSQY